MAKKTISKVYARVIATLLFIGVLAGTWDAWWHGAVGRDTFWEPPHILLYSSVIITLLIGLYCWKKTKEKSWRNLGIALLFIPLAAPFDELWHTIFGVEDLTSPLIVWSPPHLMIVFGFLASLFLVFPVLKRDTKEAQVLFGSMLLASALSLLHFLTSPLIPEGGWHLLGFYGAGIVSVTTIFVLLLAKKKLPSLGGVMFTALFFLATSAIGFNEMRAEGIVFLPHDHAPPFLTIFSTLLGAAIISLANKKNTVLIAGIAALLSSGLMYGFAWMFFHSEFVYSFTQGIIAIVASTVGGIIAAKIVEKVT